MVHRLIQTSPLGDAMGVLYESDEPNQKTRGRVPTDALLGLRETREIGNEMLCPVLEG